MKVLVLLAVVAVVLAGVLGTIIRSRRRSGHRAAAVEQPAPAPTVAPAPAPAPVDRPAPTVAPVEPPAHDLAAASAPVEPAPAPDRPTDDQTEALPALGATFAQYVHADGPAAAGLEGRLVQRVCDLLGWPPGPGIAELLAAVCAETAAHGAAIPADDAALFDAQVATIVREVLLGVTPAQSTFVVETLRLDDGPGAETAVKPIVVDAAALLLDAWATWDATKPAAT